MEEAFIERYRRCIGREQLFLWDNCKGLGKCLGEYYPEAQGQRCPVPIYRKGFSKVPRRKEKNGAAMLKMIPAPDDRQAAQEKSKVVGAKLKVMKLPAAARRVECGIVETYMYTGFPRERTLR